jgi:DNA-binding Xre family transcriptional regulator
MSVDELAVLVGVSPKTVSRWETAVSDIKLTELERVCDALSVTPKQIFEPSTVPDL